MCTDLDFSQNIIRVIKPRKIRWTVHVASVGEKRDAYRVLMGEPEGKSRLESSARR
jgi:hypothetical protein